MSTSYNSLQQSRQARNRPTHAVSEASHSALDQTTYKALKDDESFEELQRKERSARILERMEVLCWFSGVRGESIPQTRRHFMLQLAGLSPSPSPSPSSSEASEDEESDDDGNNIGESSLRAAGRKKSGAGSSSNTPKKASAGKPKATRHGSSGNGSARNSPNSKSVGGSSTKSPRGSKR